MVRYLHYPIYFVLTRVFLLDDILSSEDVSNSLGVVARLDFDVLADDLGLV